MINYTMLVERDVDSGWLVGEVAELPGCYTQAPDWARLEVNMREAIGAWLADHEDYVAESEFVGAVRLEAAP